MLVIVHAGQTGVERGAHEAARAAGIGIAGFMPNDGRDELGLVPAHVAERLMGFPERGHRPPMKANIELCSAALIVVPKVETAETVPALLWIIQRVRARRIPICICDETYSRMDVGSWIASLRSDCGSIRLLVTGPRATRWAQGERLTRRILTACTVH